MTLESKISTMRWSILKKWYILHSLKCLYRRITENFKSKKKKKRKINVFDSFQWQPEVTANVDICKGHCHCGGRLSTITESYKVLSLILFEKNVNKQSIKSVIYRERTSILYILHSLKGLYRKITENIEKQKKDNLYFCFLPVTARSSMKIF